MTQELKTFYATIKIKNKKVDSFPVSAESKKKAKEMLKEFYYRTGKVENIDDFDCMLVETIFDGNFYYNKKNGKRI